VSSSLFCSQRGLMRRIETLYARSKLIDRNCGSTVDPSPTANRSASDCLLPDGLSDEGDILLSPSTVILLTSLAKIKQRPLPGHTGQHGIRARITTVSLKFEHILVFISDGPSSSPFPAITPPPTLDERDTLALADFQAFCAASAASAVATYIPGGEDVFARHVVNIMAANSFAPRSSHNIASDNLLLERESLWERFLRKAGMNIFAAQVVLHTLSTVDLSNVGRAAADANSADPADMAAVARGLSAFLAMPAGARTRTFAGVLGGERVLSKVNGVLEGVFVSRGYYKSGR
jgi:hypothetical protein